MNSPGVPPQSSLPKKGKKGSKSPGFSVKSKNSRNASPNIQDNISAVSGVRPNHEARIQSKSPVSHKSKSPKPAEDQLNASANLQNFGKKISPRDQPSPRMDPNSQNSQISQNFEEKKSQPKEITAQQKADIQALLTRLNKAEHSMKQAKSDILTDAMKRVTKGNIIKKKNELLKDELSQSQSNSKSGGDMHAEVEQSMLHISTAKLKLEKRLNNIQTEIDAKDDEIRNLSGTVTALQQKCTEQDIRIEQLQQENKNLRDQMAHGGQLPLPPSKYMKGKKQDVQDNLWEGLQNNADAQQSNPSDLWVSQGKNKYKRK